MQGGRSTESSCSGRVEDRRPLRCKEEANVALEIAHGALHSSWRRLLYNWVEYWEEGLVHGVKGNAIKNAFFAYPFIALFNPHKHSTVYFPRLLQLFIKGLSCWVISQTLLAAWPWHLQRRGKFCNDVQVTVIWRPTPKPSLCAVKIFIQVLTNLEGPLVSGGGRLPYIISKIYPVTKQVTQEEWFSVMQSWCKWWLFLKIQTRRVLCKTENKIKK